MVAGHCVMTGQQMKGVCHHEMVAALHRCLKIVQTTMLKQIEDEYITQNTKLSSNFPVAIKQAEDAT